MHSRPYLCDWALERLFIIIIITDRTNVELHSLTHSQCELLRQKYIHVHHCQQRENASFLSWVPPATPRLCAAAAQSQPAGNQLAASPLQHISTSSTPNLHTALRTTWHQSAFIWSFAKCKKKQYSLLLPLPLVNCRIMLLQKWSEISQSPQSKLLSNISGLSDAQSKR